jgi:hypothetical protein
VYWAEEIIPSEKYDYWCYVAEGMSFYFNESPHFVKEHGDKAFRKYAKITPPHYGFFVGCHPSSCSQFIVVKNKKVQYIDTCTGLRDFIGNIDNIEEALLYAESYGYHGKGQSYKTYNNRYEFTASKASNAPVTIIITKDGFIRVEPIKQKMRLVALQSFAIAVFLVFTSCNNRKKTEIQVDSIIAIPYSQEFYNVKYNHEIAALVSKINPGKDYDYWSYIGETTREFGNKKLKMLINMDSVVKARQYSDKVLLGKKW